MDGNLRRNKQLVMTRRAKALAVGCCMMCVCALPWVAQCSRDRGEAAEPAESERPMAPRPADSDGPMFLKEFDGLRAEGHGPVFQIVWEECSTLPSVAKDVLETYRDAGGYTVSGSGYLDLRGAVWGCLIRGVDAVDLVLVTERRGGVSRARAIRITAGV